MNTNGRADHAGAAAGKVADALERRDADGLRVEKEKVGVEAGSDHAALGNAVLAGGIGGEAEGGFLEGEGAGLAYPVGEEVEAEARIAEVDEVRAGVG